VTHIETRPLGPGHFGVEIHEGDVVVHREVVVDGNLLDDMALIDVDPRRVAEETIGFLLDRHVATELPDPVSIRDVDRMEPDYRSELTARLATP
jgi:hypothetical protein